MEKNSILDLLIGFSIVAVLLIVLCGIGYVIYWYFYKRNTGDHHTHEEPRAPEQNAADGAHPAATTTPADNGHGDHGGHGPTVTRPEPTTQTGWKEFWSFVILLLSYFIVLWGIKVLFPTIWKAWSGDGFILSQVLLLSAILIFSFVHPKKLRWLGWIPGLLAVIAIILTVIGNFPAIPKYKLDKDAMESMLHINVPGGSSNGGDTAYAVDTSKNQYQIPVVLKKPGDKMTLDIMPYYSCDYSNPGNEYYYQGSNQSQPEIVGKNRKPKDHPHTTSFTLSYKDSAVKIICTFRKVPH